MESYAVGETFEHLAPEQRHRIYKLLRLGVRFRPVWPLEITGVFAQVGEEAEAETGLSNSRPSPPEAFRATNTRLSTFAPCCTRAVSSA
jgi:hypothetical protein